MKSFDNKKGGSKYSTSGLNGRLLMRSSEHKDEVQDYFESKQDLKRSLKINEKLSRTKKNSKTIEHNKILAQS